MDDAGSYMVKALNIGGEVRCSSVLTVVPSMNANVMHTESNHVQLSGFPPEFLQLFTDRQSSINSTIKFEARLIGAEPMSVRKFFLTAA